jgi:hypothetical protein
VRGKNGREGSTEKQDKVAGKTMKSESEMKGKGTKL